MESYIKRVIVRNSGADFEEAEDNIAIEKRLRILINGKEMLSMYCTPLMIRELVVGMLMSENLITGKWCGDKMSIVFGDEVTVDVPADGNVSTEGAVITSGCIGGITFPKRAALQKTDDPFTISAVRLRELFSDFQKLSSLHQLTGCIHSAGLSDGESVLCIAEDIGRHNAVDKVIGFAILEEIPFAGKIMLASGRLSSEIVAKCGRWGIPVVGSRTSPTSLALEIADKCGVTVAGFIRGDRLNVYTNPQRIIL
jgi:FdhD protein